MFDIGVIDPPWKYNNDQGKDPARGGFVYPPMTRKDLCELPLHTVFNERAVLFIWVTAPQLVGKEKGISIPDVIESWGFEPATIAFCWRKTYRNGSPYSGTGRYTNSNEEFVIVAKRGKMLPRANKNVKQHIYAPITKHSEKPAELYTRIEDLFGFTNEASTPYNFIEFFARKQNPPPHYYTATGIDYDNTLIQDYLKNFAAI